MSKDMLGSLVRVLVTVPEHRLGLVKDVAHKLSSRDGDEWEPLLKECLRKERKPVSSAEPVEGPPDLRNTGQTFGDWLVAREKLHLFLTGETVVLRDMFAIPDELLSRTDIIPVFRPAGATNRMAMNWQTKLGMNSAYEESPGVDEYKNAGGPEQPELSYISRSVRPDEDTLGKNARSPDQLIAIKGKKWLNLYGWSDANNLHFLITGEYLDSGDTWTWFPEDRLQGDGEVACGRWYSGNAQAGFCWGRRRSCRPSIGARVAIPIPLKPRS